YALLMLPFGLTMLVRGEKPAKVILQALAFGAGIVLVYAPVFFYPDPETAHLERRFETHARLAHVSVQSFLPALRAATSFVFGKTGTIALGICLLLAGFVWLGSRLRRAARARQGASGIRAALRDDALFLELS